ncbi:MAG: hypothetical protein ACI9DC_005244 [Gammaproteobacteria bacterium]|jgi:hypothetical protein
MAWPVIVAVAKAVPWLALVQQAPGILEAANRLRTRSNSTPDLPSDERSPESEVAEVRAALAQLQRQNEETAEVIRQLAEQNQEMAVSIQTLAEKTKALGYGLFIAIILAMVAATKVLL